MAWQFSGGEAVYLQIVRRLRGMILQGQYPPDGQFPSVRQLATEAAVNPNTMQKSLACLEEEGLLYTKGTLGRFVTSDKAILSAAKEKACLEAVREWLCQAKQMGISPEELIEYIKKEADEI